MAGVYGRTFGKIHENVSIRRRRRGSGGAAAPDPGLPRLVAGRGTPREERRPMLTPLRAVVVALLLTAGAAAVFGLEALFWIFALQTVAAVIWVGVAIHLGRRPAFRGPPLRRREPETLPAPPEVEEPGRDGLSGSVRDDRGRLG